MASLEIEAQFLAAWLAEAQARKESAVRIMGHIRSDMLEYEQIADAYDYLVQRHAAGKPMDDLEVQTSLRGILGDGWYLTIWNESKKDGEPARTYAARVLLNFRARRQAQYLGEAAAHAKALVDQGDEGKARKLADEIVSKLTSFHHNEGDLSKPVTREDITKRALERLRTQKGSEGIRMPYQKLYAEMGNLLPGDMVGVAAYSNGGKSLFGANLFRHFAISGVPQIIFPTEMGLAWHARAVASHAKVPQMIAEREQWELASQDQLEAYEFALNDLGRCPWEIVPQGSITVDQIIARANVIRRRWPGKPVVVMIDHLHRLDYGREDPDYGVGPATLKLRNWAREDDMGGIIIFALYQPRKPTDEIEHYKPVSGYQIRGKSTVWNELDILLTPYRRWVVEHPMAKTPWGTKAARTDGNGRPVFAAPNSEGAKLDDEHVYVKLAKRRVGGEGPTIMLDVEGPTGHIRDINVDNGRPTLAVVR